MICDAAMGDWINSALRDAWHKEAERDLSAAKYLPRPEEIARQTALIRDSWSDEERERRLRPDWRSNPVTIPVGGNDFELRERFLLMGD